MSQDLLSEFDSLYSAPVPATPATPAPAPTRSFAPAPTTSSRRFTSVDPRDPLNLNLPPAPRTQLPLHNVPLIRTASHGHKQRASATTFDDLLGIVGSPQAPWPPRAPQVARLGQTQRPVSFHGTLPSSSKIDPFAAMGDDFSGGDGRGGRFTPPPPRPTSRDFNGPSRPTSRNDFSSFDMRRKPSMTGMGKSVGAGAFGFSAPTPPPDLLGMGDGEEDDDDFGDFASATPVPVLTPIRASTPAPPPAPASYFGGFDSHSTPNTTPPRTAVLGVQQSGSNLRTSTPPPPPTPPKPKHRHQKSLIDDDDDFGEFMTSPTTSKPPHSIFSTPPPFNTTPPRNTFSTPPPNRFSTPPPQIQNSNRHSIALRTFSPPKPKPPNPPPQPQIPPVSILLTAFPPLFLLPQTHLLDKLTTLPFPLRQRVLAHPKTKEFLEGVCELGRVAGRIIAGRKRRNRPSLPSARNRSSSRGSGGMKLGAAAGNASWEQQKEEREVKETCRLWGDGAGRLKAAMGKGVPEIVDEAVGGRGMVGRGSVSGPVCRLCELGKGEVVAGLKEKMEKGGWWVEGWGHGGCRAFWERHGKGLRG